jgi:hypothetical protein
LAKRLFPARHSPISNSEHTNHLFNSVQFLYGGWYRLWGVLQPSEIKVLGLNTAAKLILSTPKVIGQTFRAKIGKIIAKEKVQRF